MSGGGGAGGGLLRRRVHLRHLHPGQVQLGPGGQLPVLSVLEQTQANLGAGMGEGRGGSTRQGRCGGVLEGSMKAGGNVTTAVTVGKKGMLHAGGKVKAAAGRAHLPRQLCELWQGAEARRQRLHLPRLPLAGLRGGQDGAQAVRVGGPRGIGSLPYMHMGGR